MNFSTWLRTWLENHPLKTPAHHDPLCYTTEVMKRVETLRPTPLRVPAYLWGAFAWPRSRLTFAVGAAMAGFALTLTVANLSHRQLVKNVFKETQLLAALDESEEVEPVAGNTVDTLAQDLELTDAFTVAAFSSDEDRWLGQTLQLLEQLDEQERQLDPSDEDHESGHEEWLRPFDALDDTA